MKRFLPITFLVLAAWLSTGCDNQDFFELTNPTEPPWLNATEFDAAAVGAYYALTGNAGSRAIFSHQRLANSVTSDVGVYLPEAAGNVDIQAVYNRQHSEIGMFNNAVFGSSYAVVAFANGVLDFIEENNGQPYPYDVKRDQVPRIEGEMRFLRAYAYWSLAKVYVPPYSEAARNTPTTLPYRITAPKSLDAANRSEFFTVGRLYDLIVADLQRAKQVLPNRYDPALGHPPEYGKGRVNKFGAAAMLSRVYQQMGKLSESAAEATFVIEQSGNDYALTEDPLEAFNKKDDGRGKETIWWYNIGAPGSDGLRQGSNWKVPRRFSSYNWTDENNWSTANSNDRTVAVSDAFLKKAGWVDDNLNETQAARNDKRYKQLFVRVEAGKDPRFKGLPNRPFVWGNKYYRGARSDESNIVLLRLAEMYLNRSIARFRAGDRAGAAADLNVVRARAWDAAAVGRPYTPLAAGEITEDMIHTERMIEMVFEGDRTPYLQGLRLDIPNGDRGPGSIAWNAEGLYFEIPAREMELNQGFQTQ